MKYRLYWRLFLSTAAVVFAGFVILTGILAVLLSSKRGEEQMEHLRSQAAAIAESLVLVEKEQNYSDELKRMATAFSDTNGSTVFFINRSGLVTVCSDAVHDPTCPHTDLIVNTETLRDVFVRGWFEETGDFFGLYDSAYHTVGVLIVGMGGNYDSAVFVCAKAGGVMDYVAELLEPFGIALAVLLTVIYFVILLICRRVTRPIREISEATKAMANGDFTHRVHTNRSDEVGELARHFNSMADSLAALDSMSNSFITNVSHDLRTPMTTISGFVDGILDGTVPPDEQRRYLLVVSNEVKRLSATVNTMLSLSKILSGLKEIEQQPVELSELIVRVFMSFELALSEKQIDVLGLDGMPIVMTNGDGQLLYQAIYNLVDNAVKFTPPGGYISVSVSENTNDVALYIKNSGHGISETDQQHIFERFYKSDKSRSEDKQGAGVGLFIVKSIVTVHGGTVSVKSVEGQYSQFCVRLPCSRK